MIKRLLVVLIVFSSGLNAQNKFNKTELDEFITNAVDQLAVPGLAVGIIKDSAIVFSKGYGFREIGKDAKIDNNTLFGIASCSKAFTATLIGSLVDEGKLKWNDRVIDHLPEFKLSDPYVTREMRINDLLCHRAGYNTFDGDLLWYGTDYTFKEILNRFFHMPAKNSFRSTFGYSNIMFIAAGEVIEKVTGKTWAENIRERILDPLQMNSTKTSILEYDSDENLAMPHLDDKVQTLINYDNAGPAAGLNASVNDLLIWANLWLNKGTLEGKKIISSDSYYAITKSYTSLNAGKGEKIGGRHFLTTGLGWFNVDAQGRKVITHSGGLPGYLSRVVFIPEENLGIVVLHNGMEGIVRPVVYKIRDMFLNLESEDYIKQAVERKEKYQDYVIEREEKLAESRIDDTEPSLELEEYVGLYNDKMYGNTKIELVDDDLIFTMVPTKELLSGKLEHWHHNTFKVEMADPSLPPGFVTFNFDKDESLIGFNIELKNPDFHFYNLDFKKVEENTK